MKHFLIRLFLISSVLAISFMILRFTIRPLSGTTFRIYGSDVLGFIYKIESNCGFIGSCTNSYQFLGEHSSNFTVVQEAEDCNIGKGKALYSNGSRLDFRSYSIVQNTEFFKTEKGFYYSCGRQKIELDPHTASVINKHCITDAKKVFCYGRYLSELDARNTRILNEYFAVTESEVWFLPQEMLVTELDPQTFIYIGQDKSGSYYIRDVNGMYQYDWTNRENPLKRINAIP